MEDTVFGPTKVAIILDKPTAVCGIGFVLAICGVIMLKNGIEKIINGGGRYGRTQGFIVSIIACVFLVSGIATIFETKTIVSILADQVSWLFTWLEI